MRRGAVFLGTTRRGAAAIGGAPARRRAGGAACRRAEDVARLLGRFAFVFVFLTRTRPFPANILCRWASICAIIDPGFGTDAAFFCFARSLAVGGSFVFVFLSFFFLKP